MTEDERETAINTVVDAYMEDRGNAIGADRSQVVAETEDLSDEFLAAAVKSLSAIDDLKEAGAKLENASEKVRMFRQEADAPPPELLEKIAAMFGVPVENLTVKAVEVDVATMFDKNKRRSTFVYQRKQPLGGHDVLVKDAGLILPVTYSSDECRHSRGGADRCCNTCASLDLQFTVINSLLAANGIALSDADIMKIIRLYEEKASDEDTAMVILTGSSPAETSQPN